MLAEHDAAFHFRYPAARLSPLPMHTSHLLGAGAVCVALGWFLVTDTPPVPPAAPSVPAVERPVANGHYVLVVEGTRNELAITAASHKADAWAGVPKGLSSAWRLRIADANGTTLAEVPLDMRPFDTDANAPLRPVRVEGCIVHSGAVGMLVNAPAFAAAASYTFLRPEPQGEPTPIGSATGEQVRTLAGGGR